MTIRYGVWCQVSGGITGSHNAWLKTNGNRVEFDTRAEAEGEVARLIMTIRYGVWCQVSGGITGSHNAWLKTNGNRVEFDTRAEAEGEVARLMQRFASNPHRTVQFRYTAQAIYQ